MRAFTWTDIDEDLVPDAIAVGTDGERRYFLNLRGGLFRKIPETQELREASAMGEAWGRGRINADLDNNGAADALLMTPGSTEAQLEIAAGTPPLSLTLPFRVGASVDSAVVDRHATLMERLSGVGEASCGRTDVGKSSDPDRPQ